jgi:pyruvate formate lyase activating enzyme
MPRLENEASYQQFSAARRGVLNIYRMTTHNGPGIRTLIQFKGCPLRCLWCSTPESQKGGHEIAVYPAKCIRCNRCAAACPANAIKAEDDGISIDRLLCDNCGKCADVCCSGALELLGRDMTVEELLEEVRRDDVFYRHSGGGVTLSGGEPLMDCRFTGMLLKALKENGISVGVDTCGYVPWDSLEPLLPYIDFFLWDIKHMDPDIHQSLTGVSNGCILHNARAASERGIPIFLRLPVIPGCNDSEENIRVVCAFAQQLPSLAEVDLIPLHHLGKARYCSLNRPYPMPDTAGVSIETVQEMKKLIQSYNLQCRIVT